MAYNSAYIKGVWQETNDNPNSWGDILTDSALQLLEDAVAGAASVDVTSGNATLSDTAGGPSAANAARYMIVNVIGSQGADGRQIIAPSTQVVGNPSPKPRTKVYLINNQSAFAVTVLTDAGGSTGPSIPAGQARWVYIDGTNGIAVEADVTLASDSTNLGGEPAASYARLDQGTDVQSFTAGQATVRVALPTGPSAPNYRPDLALSNSFSHTTSSGEAMVMRTPSSPIDGGQFSIVIRQGTGGGTISFADSAYAFAGGAAPSLSVGLDKRDYLAFEYSGSLSAWIGSIIKDVSVV